MSEKSHISKMDQKAVAVARKDQEQAPKITAKGSGYNADKILDIAFSNGVKVRQDKDLTKLLDQFEIDSPVPLEALHAVSLILERVYSYNNSTVNTVTETTSQNPQKRLIEQNDD